MRELRGLGLSPDLIVCRSKKEVTAAIRGKISMFCHVPSERVLSVHDCSSIYRVPLLLTSQGVYGILEKLLGLPPESPVETPLMTKWRGLADR